MSAGRPRVLVLDEEPPYPADTGKKIRTYNLLQRLAGRFEIDLLVHDSDDARERAAPLEAHGLNVHVAASRVPSKRGPMFYARLARSLFSRDPYSVSSHFRVGYLALLRQLATSRRPVVVHCEWTPYAGYFDATPALAAIPRVVSAHNVESQIWRRMAREERSRARRAFIGLQAERMERFERRIFRGGSWVTAVSEQDARQICEFGGERVRVVPNGVDTVSYPRADDDRIRPGTLVFSGSMDWRPNQDAVRWFVETIHPLLLRRGPYRLQVVGRRPPPWLVERCAAIDEIETTGSVPEVQPYLWEAEIIIVPLRIGGGSRLKILEAFSSGRAVISTSVGAEGLDVVDGEHLLLADEPQAFVDAIVRMRGDAALRRRLAAAGRALVEQRYDWDRIAEIQAALWSEAAE